MTNRWLVLALLFCVRTTMAFQYQAVAALSPFLMHRFGVGLADIGLLIGLYLSPGIVIALPGGAIGRRFGDKRTVALGLALMLAGGLVIALLPSWEAQVAGRVLSGVGGVTLNVLMSKMVVDWFAGREIASAMAIYINSWPVGIAAALVLQPLLATRFGLTATMLVIVGLVALGLLALVTLYRTPDAHTAAAATPAPLRGAALAQVLLSAGIWGLYNSALTMIFGFGPAMLAGRGWSASAASSTTSIVLWIISLSVPLGGVLADRLGRRDTVLAAGLVGSALLMMVTPEAREIVPLFVALGLIAGLSAGPILSLPAEVLVPGNRAWGMGLFFTVFYISICLTPVIAGHLAETLGTPEVVFPFGGAMMAAGLVLLAVVRMLARPTAVTVPGTR